MVSEAIGLGEITLGGKGKIKREAYLALTFGKVYFEITYKGDG